MAGGVEPGVAPGELYCPTCEKTLADVSGR